MIVFDEYAALYNISKEIVRGVILKAQGDPKEDRIKMSCFLLLEYMDHIGARIGYPNLVKRYVLKDNPFAAIRGTEVSQVLAELCNVSSFNERLSDLEENAKRIQQMTK